MIDSVEYVSPMWLQMKHDLEFLTVKQRYGFNYNMKSKVCSNKSGLSSLHYVYTL